MRKNRLVSIMLFLAIALSSLAGVGSSIAIEGKAKGIKDVNLNLQNSEMSFLNDMIIRNAISADIKPDDLQKIGLGRFSIEDIFKFIPYLNKNVKDNLSKIKISSLINRLGDLSSSLPNLKNRNMPLFEGKRNFSRLIIKVKDAQTRIDIKGYLKNALTSAGALSVLASGKTMNFTVSSFGSSKFGKVFVVSLPSSINLYSIMSLLKSNPNIEYVEPDYQFKLFTYPVYPNDPRFSEQWYLNNSSDHDIDAPEAWRTTTGSDDIVVAIVDSGIECTHEDLSPNVWTNPEEIPDNGIDDDHNGYVDDVMGWNFVLDNNNVTDNLGHGTWCAGIVGAVGNNSKGIAGLNWHCKIMSVKCFDYLPVSFASILAKGIIYATDNGADVISLSWGAPVDSKLIRDAISYAESKGVIVVAAAGNFGNRLKIYPAAYPSVIAVAATDSNDEITSFSNWGGWIDISAPGESIVSTWTNGGYSYESGTSASAPLVAGTIALMLSEKPDATRDEILTALKSGAEPVTTYGYRYIGIGRLNVNNSLDRLTGIVASLDKNIGGAIVSGVIAIKGSAFGPEFSTYHLYYGKGVYPATWHEFYNSSSQVVNGVLASWDTTSLDDGLYTIKLEVIDNHSKVYTDMIILTVNNVQNVWYVGGSGPRNFTSIQDAILESGDGDVVFVYNGSYNENLILIDRDVDIIGESRDGVEVYGEGMFYISASGVELHGLTLRFPYFDVVLDKVSNVKVSGCKLSKRALANVFIANSTNITIEDNIIERYDFSIVSIPLDIEKLSQGLYDLNISMLINSLDIQPRDTTIKIINNTDAGVICLVCSDKNEIKNNTLSGIFFIDSSSNVVENNSISNGGMFVYNSYNNRAENNSINGKDLIYLEDESGKAIEEGGQVILVNCSDIAVRNLNISNIFVSAVEIFDSINCSVYDTDISYANIGILSIKSRDTTIANSNFTEIGFGVISMAGRDTDIIDNNIFGAGIGVAIIDIDDVDLEFNGSSLTVGIEFNEGRNTIIGNSMKEMYAAGIVIISPAENNIRDNTITSHSLLVAGIADISISSIYMNIGPNTDLSSKIVFGKGKQTLLNNYVSNVFIGTIVVSDSSVEVAEFNADNSSIGIVVLSPESINVISELMNSFNTNGRVEITFSHHNISIHDSNIESLPRNEIVGMMILSNSAVYAKNNRINGIRNSAGIIDISSDHININFETEVEGKTFEQSVEVEIKSGGADREISKNTMYNVSHGILSISGGDIEVKGNEIMDLYIDGITTLSFDVLYLEFNSTGVIRTDPDLPLDVKKAYVQANIVGKASSLCKVSDNVLCAIKNFPSCQWSIAVIFSNTIIENNMVYPNEGIGVLSISIENVRTEANLIRNSFKLDISFADPISNSRINNNRVTNTSIGIVTVSNGSVEISDNRIRNIRAIGISYSGIESLHYDFAVSNFTGQANITICGSSKDADISDNRIENVGFSIGNLSSGILIAGGKHVDIENNIILNLSHELPSGINVYSNGILIADPNIDARWLRNSTEQDIDITVFSESGNHTIRNNLIKDGQACGISLWYSSGNEIYRNRIENVSIGVFIPLTPIPELNISVSPGIDSNDNIIYHNNLINNTAQAIDNWNNIWNLTYPYGGNYWSDYDGEDIYRGVEQNMPGSDNLGDIPYNISGDNNKDIYPLMFEYGKMPPLASFSYTPSSPCKGETVEFTDESIDIDGSVVGWTWDFGDGNTSYEQNPSHIYSASGIYVVSLTVLDNDGLSTYYSTPIMVLEKDVTPPVISNVTIDPVVQVYGGYVNISCDVEDNVEVSHVKINITYPDESQYNLSMNKLNDTYYLNQSYNMLGEYNFYIWAIDTSNNSISSSIYNFGIIDVVPPTIIDNTPSYATTGDPLVFNATVTNTAGIDNVFVEYWYGDGIHHNVTMDNVADNWWIREITVEDTLEPLHYIISAVDSYGNWNKTMEKKINITDNDAPSIQDIEIYPSIQALGGFVNISCDVEDNVAVQEVKINISYPDGSYQNVSMNKLGSNEYYLNQSYDLLGTYSFIIWAVDTSNNSNVSSEYNFEIIDVTPPTIVDNTPPSATTGDFFTFNATVTNTAEISNVYIEYWYGNGTHFNESMSNMAGNWWTKEITIADTLQPLHYIISAVDSYGNWNRTLEKDVEITDDDEPVISDISITPDVQDVGEYVNISCIVQDNIKVDDVWINITDPLGHSVEIKMSKIGNMHYINYTYSILGNYSFTIFANDTSGNLAQSSVFTFRIVEVNMSVKLKKPVEKGLYFNDRYLKLFRPKMTIIIGKITLSADIEDGIGNVTVYFYVNGDLKAKIENPPYTWTFNERMFGRKCTIRVVAEDEYGHTAEYSVQARIFNLGIFSK